MKTSSRTQPSIITEAATFIVSVTASASGLMLRFDLGKRGQGATARQKGRACGKGGRARSIRIQSAGAYYHVMARGKSCGLPPQSGEVDARASHLRRGWYWGTQAFGDAMRKLGQKLMKRAAPASRAYQKHELVREHEEKYAKKNMPGI